MTVKFAPHLDTDYCAYAIAHEGVVSPSLWCCISLLVLVRHTFYSSHSVSIYYFCVVRSSNCCTDFWNGLKHQNLQFFKWFQKRIVTVYWHLDRFRYAMQKFNYVAGILEKYIEMVQACHGLLNLPAGLLIHCTNYWHLFVMVFYFYKMRKKRIKRRCFFKNISFISE